MRPTVLDAGESRVSRKKAVVWTIVAIAAAAAVTVALRMHRWRPRSITIQGAVIRRDEDSRKELPIAGATVTASDGVSSANTESGRIGIFQNYASGHRLAKPHGEAQFSPRRNTSRSI